MVAEGKLIAITVQTAGQDKENLGCDEAEVVYVAWAVVDTKTAIVETVLHSYVQPSDLGKVNWETLKEQGISEENVRTAAPLGDVIHQHTAALEIAGGGGEVRMVAVGPLTLRQVLHPEALKKDVELPPIYHSYYDLRKAVATLFNNNQHIEAASGTLKNACALLGVTPTTDVQPQILSDCHDFAAVVAKILQESNLKGIHDCFGEADLVKKHLEHGICSKSDIVDTNTIVRARGLPWQSSDQDVARFFIGLNIAKGGVALCLSAQGRRNGEALVRFESVEHRDLALRRHRHFMGNRYIEIYRATSEDFMAVASGNNTEAQEFLSRGAEVIIRMRGLPYDSTAQQILDFFAGGANSPNSGGAESNGDVALTENGDGAVDAEVAVIVDPTTGVEVMGGEAGILFVNKADGRATGDAFVLLKGEADCVRALAKHKQLIGTRYIELFRSTTAEVQQVINKSMEPPKMDPTVNPGLIGAMPHLGGLGGLQSAAGLGHQQQNVGGLPQQLVISGARKDCIRLRGLPYEAQVQHILDFLGDYSKHIVFQGVHMVYNAQGHPSGEAFIQMDSEHAAAAASADRHNKYMQIVRKQRYIEVFQCSADDMNLVLTGPAGAMPAGTGMLNPAMAAAIQGGRLPLSPGSFPAANGGGLASPSSGTLPTSMIGGGGGVGGLTAAQAALLNHPQLMNAVAFQNGTVGGGGANPFLQMGGAGGLRMPFSQGLTNGLIPTMTNQGAVMYWPYPSPPVSPSSGFYAAAAAAQQQQQQLMAAAVMQHAANQQQQQAQQQQQQLAAAAAAGTPTMILMRKLPFNTSTTDILGFFQGFPEVTAEHIQIQRAMTGQPTGDAIVTFTNRLDAERAVLEKSRQLLGQCPVELFLCA